MPRACSPPFRGEGQAHAHENGPRRHPRRCVPPLPPRWGKLGSRKTSIQLQPARHRERVTSNPIKEQCGPTTRTQRLAAHAQTHTQIARLQLCCSPRQRKGKTLREVGARPLGDDERTESECSRGCQRGLVRNRDQCTSTGPFSFLLGGGSSERTTGGLVSRLR